MSINLSINFSHPDAIAHRVSFARIDNTLNPVYTTVSPDPTSSPTNIATNIPNGQYSIRYHPIYADLRTCSDQLIETAACPGLISINAYLDGNNIIVQYFAPSEIVKVKINVSYPTGGSYSALFVNNGNNIPIALPNNVFGDFLVTGQSVCDEESGFYSPPSSQVTITRSQTTVTISNQSSDVNITSVTGISGYTLSLTLTPSNTDTGTHNAFTGQITLGLSGGSPIDGSASMLLNGTLIQCVNIITSTVTFNSASFAETDSITITISDAACI